MGLKRIGKAIATGGFSELDKVGKKAFGSGPGPNIPEVDPRIKQLAKEQQAEADAFKKNLSNMKQQEFNIASEGIRKDLAQGTRDVQSAANQRGLLYSGLRQEAEADLGAQAGSQMATTRQEINRNLDDQAKQMQLQALQTDLGVLQMQQNREAQLYQAALQRKAARGQMLGGLGGAIGGIAGLAMGGPVGAMAGSQIGSNLGTGVGAR